MAVLCSWRTFFVWGNWLEMARFCAPPRGGPPLLHKAKRATSWAARFALCSVQKNTGQQIERVVALRKLRIATITIPKLLKLMLTSEHCE
jgi:hypothetical protein